MFYYYYYYHWCTNTCCSFLSQPCLKEFVQIPVCRGLLTEFFGWNSSDSNRMETTSNFTSKPAWAANSEVVRRIETRWVSFDRSLDYASGSESIIFSNELCKPIKIYLYVRNKHPFTSYPAEKHQKHSKFAITEMQHKPVDFFYCTARASTSVPAIILLI